MNDEQLERRLRRLKLPPPSPDVRPKLLRAASRRKAARRRRLALRWVFAGAAALLLAINVAFDYSHAQAVHNITGQASVHMTMEHGPRAVSLLHRRQALSRYVRGLDQSWRG